jgi:hypothetical protein
VAIFHVEVEARALRPGADPQRRREQFPAGGHGQRRLFALLGVEAQLADLEMDLAVAVALVLPGFEFLQREGGVGDQQPEDQHQKLPETARSAPPLTALTAGRQRLRWAK